MARIPYISLKRGDGYALEILDDLDERIGKRPNFHMALAQSPGLLGTLGDALKHLRHGGLGEDVRRLVYLDVARRLECEYALANPGIFFLGDPADDDLLAALADPESATDRFDARQRAVLRYVAEIVGKTRPSEPALAGVAMVFDARQMVELVALVSLCEGICRFCITLGIDAEGRC